MKPLLEKQRERLLFGACYATSIVLSEELGWSIGALMVDVPSPSRNGWQTHPVHSFLISPDGYYFDAGGTTDEADLKDRYLAHTARKFRDPRIVEFHDAVAFRNELRCLYLDERVDPGERTDYDDLLDDQLPHVRRIVKELDLVNQATSELLKTPSPS